MTDSERLQAATIAKLEAELKDANFAFTELSDRGARALAEITEEREGTAARITELEGQVAEAQKETRRIKDAGQLNAETQREKIATLRADRDRLQNVKELCQPYPVSEGDETETYRSGWQGGRSAFASDVMRIANAEPWPRDQALDQAKEGE